MSHKQKRQAPYQGACLPRFDVALRRLGLSLGRLGDVVLAAVRALIASQLKAGLQATPVGRGIGLGARVIRVFAEAHLDPDPVARDYRENVLLLVG